MAGRKSDFTLPTNTLDDLFSTQEERDDAKLSKIRDIPLELIDDFPDHPFKVRDDEDMIQLVESVKERGVITLATVRQKEDGRYERFPVTGENGLANLPDLKQNNGNTLLSCLKTRTTIFGRRCFTVSDTVTIRLSPSLFLRWAM
ncbi:ParB N-terminal domain-containing protein [Faecalibacillus faecis]